VPREIVARAHAGLARHLIELDSFVTLCYARLDMSKLRIDLVDCGHTGVVHRHGRTGRLEILHGDNLPLGVREGEVYDQISVPFDPGDLFFFFSDGITEARSPAGQFFGVERLEDFLSLNADLDPAALVEGIRKTVMAFSGSDRLADDLTSVAIRVAPRTLEIASDLSQLGRVREFVRTVCRSRPMDDESESALELAVNEAASNIIKHAYHGGSGQCIRLEAHFPPDRISILLSHLGDPFDPASAPPPALDGSRESGFGTYIIAQSVDEVRYYRDEHGRNYIALAKRIDGNRG
jgi:sigma-B regulation protein RsbU (phosphoserine phosphatase)